MNNENAICKILWDQHDRAINGRIGLKNKLLFKILGKIINLESETPEIEVISELDQALEIRKK